MINFPKSTYVHKRIPKDAFYKNLKLTTALKEKFISDVDRIYIENSLTTRTLNLENETDIQEILLVSILLKKQEFDGKLVEAIASQNPHKLVFLFSFEDNRQLAVYQGKLYSSLWLNSGDLELNANGFSLVEIWEHFVEQIALYDERTESTENLSIEARLALQEDILKLEDQIEKMEKLICKEQQPKKKFELYTKLQSYKKKLADLKG